MAEATTGWDGSDTSPWQLCLHYERNRTGLILSVKLNFLMLQKQGGKNLSSPLQGETRAILEDPAGVPAFLWQRTHFSMWFCLGAVGVMLLIITLIQRILSVVFLNYRGS